MSSVARCLTITNRLAKKALIEQCIFKSFYFLEILNTLTLYIDTPRPRWWYLVKVAQIKIYFVTNYSKLLASLYSFPLHLLYYITVWRRITILLPPLSIFSEIKISYHAVPLHGWSFMFQIFVALFIFFYYNFFSEETI